MVWRALVCVAVVGCGAEFSATESTAGSGAAGAAGETGGGAAAGGEAGAGEDGGAGGGGAGDGGAAQGGSAQGGAGAGPEPLIYAASRTELYRFNPVTKLHSFVGVLAGCPDVFDLALNTAGALYAVTESSFESVDPATAVCTQVLGSFIGNALAFLPVGALDPSDEVLVAWNGGVYTRVDPQSGATTLLGSVGGGYTSSGDFVAIGNQRGLFTVYGTSATTASSRSTSRTAHS